MSSDKNVVIDVRNVSKWFQVQGKGVRKGPSETSERDQHAETKRNQFQVLNDVSLQVRRGETVGIIGRNGAGKSTLLRIISGMMKPDRGSVAIDGKPYSVMGMGIGFQKNLTGAENIHIKGAVMGATTREINRKMDWIVDFSELGDYIHQPMRTYSKGMTSRLAFAITFAFDPKILVIDEALSGGDEEFKRRTQTRLDEINEAGSTILLVSHGGAHHKRLCDKSILIDKGQLLAEGPPPGVMNAYKRLASASPEEFDSVVAEICTTDLWAVEKAAAAKRDGGVPPGQGKPKDQAGLDPDLKSRSVSASEPLGCKIVDAAFFSRTADKERLNKLTPGGRFQFQITAEAEEPLSNLTFEMCVKSESGEELFRAREPVPRKRAEMVKPGAQVKGGFAIRNRLLPGDYYADVAVRAQRGPSGEGEVSTLHRVADMVLFRVVGENDDHVEGVVDLSD